MQDLSPIEEMITECDEYFDSSASSGDTFDVLAYGDCGCETMSCSCVPPDSSSDDDGP